MTATELLEQNSLIVADAASITREEWVAMRSKAVGGSDAAVVLGLDPYRSIAELFMEKSAFVADEDTMAMQAPFHEIENQYVYWGHRLEPVVANEVGLKYGWEIWEPQLVLQSKSNPFMRANIDRLIIEDDTKEAAVLECKTAGSSRNREWKSGEIPAKYVAQVYHYMIATGIHRAYVAALIGGQRWVFKRVVWDAVIAENMIEAERKFWEAVELGVMPEALSPEGILAGQLIEEGLEEGWLIEDIYDDNDK